MKSARLGQLIQHTSQGRRSSRLGRSAAQASLTGQTNAPSPWNALSCASGYRSSSPHRLHTTQMVSVSA